MGRYWRGKGLGGSSTINGMQAIRGTPEDFVSSPLPPNEK